MAEEKNDDDDVQIPMLQAPQFQAPQLLLEDPIDELAKALNEFQSKVVSVERTTMNPFFRAKYADLASIMKESQPILASCGLSISQFPSNLNGTPALRTILMHISGQFIQDIIPLPVSRVTTVTHREKGPKNDAKEITSDGFDPQEFGRAVTYMRRYGYAAVLQIVIDEDNDGNSPAQTNAVRPQVPKDVNNPELTTKITTMWTENGGTAEQLDNWVKKNNNGMALTEIPGSRQEALLKVLEARRAASTPPPEQPPDSPQEGASEGQ